MRGILERLFCRILMLMWSLCALVSTGKEKGQRSPTGRTCYNVLTLGSPTSIHERHKRDSVSHKQSTALYPVGAAYFFSRKEPHRSNKQREASDLGPQSLGAPVAF